MMAFEELEKSGSESHRQRLIKAFRHAQKIYERLLAEHSDRVGEVASRVAAQLGLDAFDRHLAARAGAIHDLGKFGISPELIARTGPLAPHERVEVQRHPVIGAEMLLAISNDLAPLAAAVRAHHERWDGSGYPDGLSGESIPRIGRVLAVVDVYDALTSVRPYRDSLFTPAQARAYLTDNSGTQFDPTCVAAGLDVLRAEATGRRQFSVA
jgi:HD-GYP domain-containing protein (c-di-GMP phosphodiesterase class II)